jgi:hypothetical protein
MASLEKRYDGRYRIVFCWPGKRCYHSLTSRILNTGPFATWNDSGNSIGVDRTIPHIPADRSENSTED